MVSVVSNLHLSCTQILRRKTTAKTHLQLKEKDFFLSSYGRAEEKKVLIFSLRSHSVLLLTLLLADLCCTKPYWLLLFFVGIKKKMLRRFFTSLSFVISLLLSNPWNSSFPSLSKPVKHLFISFFKGTRFSNQPFPSFP